MNEENEDELKSSEGKKRGRPSEFRAGYIEIATAYANPRYELNVNALDEESKTIIERERGLIDYGSRGQAIPQLCSLSLILGVEESTVTKWREKNNAFDKACRQILATQKQLLADNALRKHWDGKTSQFMLQCNHGMIPAQRVEHEGTLSLTGLLDATDSEK